MIRFVALLSLVIVVAGMLACGGNNSANKAQPPGKMMVKQIKIGALQDELQKLKTGATEYDFIGITSDGVDCIYFTRDGDKFNVEFEAMTEDQMPYIEKLKGFASSRGFLAATTTYGNKPHNGTLAEAPVLQIRTSSDLASTAEIGATIQSAIFDNNEQTIYDVVP